MISVDEALGKILDAIPVLAPEQVNIASALGRVLAEDVVSRVTQPPNDVSAMDGYAVRASDTTSGSAQLRVVGEAPAGGSYPDTLNAGEAVRIFTGGPVPLGADSIVMQENTERASEEIVIINETAEKGRFIRAAGLDFSEGKVLITKGKSLTARDISLAAAMNVPWLMVYRRPKVAILATGDEVVMPGDPIGPNQIVSSNSLGLAATVQALGGEPILLGIAPDDEQSLRNMAAGAAGADLLVTTGGASVGDHDLIQKVLGDVGLEVNFWRIAMRPGKPLIFGAINGTPMIGLPGNPVSTMVCALVYMVPAINKMMGLVGVDAGYSSAKLATSLGANDQRQDYLRATLSENDDGTISVTPFHKQDSSMLSLLSQSDALVMRPPFADAAKTGDTVKILRFPNSRTQI